MPVEKLQFRKNSTMRRRADQGRVQWQAATLQSKSIYVKPLCENSSLAIRQVVPGSEALQSEWIHRLCSRSALAFQSTGYLALDEVSLSDSGLGIDHRGSPCACDRTLQ